MGVKRVASPLPYFATVHRRSTVTRIRGRLKVSIVLLTAPAILALAVGATPLIASAMPGIDQFGFIPTRSPIPAGAAHFQWQLPHLPPHTPPPPNPTAHTSPTP